MTPTDDPSGFAPDYSIKVEDADACAARLTALVRDPAGKLANILSHA